MGGTAGDEGSQRLAFEEFRDHVRGAFVRAHVEDGQDIRVVQCGDGAGLALEPLQALRAVGHLPGQDLDGYVAAEARVSRTVHHAHPALANLLLDAIVRHGVADQIRCRLLRSVFRKLLCHDLQGWRFKEPFRIPCLR